MAAYPSCFPRYRSRRGFNPMRTGTHVPVWFLPGKASTSGGRLPYCILVACLAALLRGRSARWMDTQARPTPWVKKFQEEITVHTELQCWFRILFTDDGRRELNDFARASNSRRCVPGSVNHSCSL